MKYIEARVIYVDTSRLCCDAVGLDGYNFYEDISYTNTGLKQSGQLYHPEIGDVFLVELSENGQAKLYRWYGQRSRDVNNLTKFVVGQAPTTKNNTQIPGDMTLAGPDGAWLSLIRGRAASIGSSPLCQTLYLGLENLIRTIGQNIDVIGSGFRAFSINDNGKITTRICFSGNDQFVAAGINDDPMTLSESFEYQLDITTDGMTLFIGNIDPDSGNRVNNATITFNPNGDIVFVVGTQIQGALYSNGTCSFKMIDSNNKVVYNRTMAVSASNLLFMKEIIKGDVVRLIDGNLSEEITGTHWTNKDTVVDIFNTHDTTTTINKTTASLNLTDLNTSPNTGITGQ